MAQFGYVPCSSASYSLGMLWLVTAVAFTTKGAFWDGAGPPASWKTTCKVCGVWGAVYLLLVRWTRMGRPNWSQIIKQISFKQALLRAHSPAKFTFPKEQGRRRQPGEMAAQFL
jgi:hypothetical protein